MATEVPLHVFVNCWRAAKLFDKEHSAYSQTKWMLEHWSFDNDIAHYAGYHVHCAASEVYEPIGVKGASWGELWLRPSHELVIVCVSLKHPSKNAN